MVDWRFRWGLTTSFENLRIMQWKCAPLTLKWDSLMYYHRGKQTLTKSLCDNLSHFHYPFHACVGRLIHKLKCMSLIYGVS